MTIVSFLKPVADACEKDILSPKWLLAPNRRIANQWKNQINLNGVATVNVHAQTIASLTFAVLSGQILERQLRVIGGDQVSVLLGQILTSLNEQNELAYLNRIESFDDVRDVLAQTISDLRLAGVAPESIENARLEVPEKRSDLAKLHHAYQEIITKDNLIDYASCLEMATALVDSGNSGLPADLCLISPLEIASNAKESELLRACSTQFRTIGPALCSNHQLNLNHQSDSDRTDNEPEDENPLLFQARFSRALGEVNEVQSVLQELIAPERAAHFDQVEILHTDYTTYVPLIYEHLTTLLSSAQVAILDDGKSEESANNHRNKKRESLVSIDQLPVTFAEGIACIYSRPGRALRSWLRWIQNDFLQTILVHAFREGLFSLSENDSVSFNRIAHRLRNLEIGFGAVRYHEQISNAIAHAQARIKQVKDSEEAESWAVSDDCDFGLADLELLQQTVDRLIRLFPGTSADEWDMPLKVLESAKQFLHFHARVTSKFDRYAKSKLVDDIDSKQRALQLNTEFTDANSIGDQSADIVQWLIELPVSSRVLASGPREGAIHVDQIRNGGHSGRKRTYVLGMDDSRYPVSIRQDPLLLDFERHSISKNLPTSRTISVRQQNEFHCLLARLRGEVVFSYATQSLAKDADQFPGSALLEVFRMAHGSTDRQFEEFEKIVGIPVSFCPAETNALISSDQWWQATLATTRGADKKTKLVEKNFAHLEFGRKFDEARKDASSLTQFDGFVPEATVALDPTLPDARRTSSHRLECFWYLSP